MDPKEASENERLLRENAALRAAMSKRDEQIESLSTELKARQREIDRLRERMQELLQRLYGRKSEKVDPSQLPLGEVTDETDPAPHVKEAPDDESNFPGPPRKKRKRASRKEKLRDLPRQRILHDVDPKDRTCSCCGKEKQRMGEEVTEEIEYVPASVTVHEHVRPKYACRSCGDGVVIADLPPRLIDGGLPGPGLVAQIVTSKHIDHLPLYRQEAIFRRHGLELSRKTMCDWIHVAADLLSPIVRSMRRELQARPVIHSDDTPIRCLTKGGPKGSRNAFLWLWLSAEEDIVIYDFHLTRGQSVVEEFLEEFQGEVIVSDGYIGYAPCASKGIERAGCWVHGRRYVKNALSTQPKEASELFALIQMLFVIEHRAAELGLDAEERLALRKKESQPILDDLRRAIDAAKPTALPQSSFGKALEYLNNQWPYLSYFVKDGRVAIENNAAERAVRPVAVGRRNWLFAGSPEGGKRAAILYSLVETCRRLEIEPFKYLRDVLSRITTHPHRLLHELTPAGWKRAKEAAATQDANSDG